MKCDLKECSSDRPLRMAGLLLILAVATGLVSADGALAEGNTTYTFKDLGYNSKSFVQGESATIYFDSQYIDVGGTINLHLYNMPDKTGRIDLELNYLPLLKNEYTDQGDQWKKIQVPTGVIRKGTNTIVIDFVAVYSEGTTLLDDSNIQINTNIAENQGNLPAVEDFQVSSPGNDSAKANLKGNGPDLMVLFSRAVGVRVARNTAEFSPSIDSVHVNFIIKNIGNEDIIEDFTTAVYVLEANKIESINISQLSAGGSFSGNVSLVIPLGYLNDKPVIVLADANNDIIELNEDNNIFETFAAIAMA